MKNCLAAVVFGLVFVLSNVAVACNCNKDKCDSCCVDKCDCCRPTLGERLAERRAERVCERAERVACRAERRAARNCCKTVCCEVTNVCVANTATVVAKEKVETKDAFAEAVKNSTPCCGNEN